MAWIKAGTVAISNGGTTVTGTGTSWLTGVNVGDALVAPDGRLYEITAINGATSLVIAPAYQGSGVSGADYIIAPTRALTGALAERVQSLINDFSDVKDNVGASKMGDFITYLLDQDTGWSRPASNTVAAVTGGVEALRLTASEASGGVVQSSATDATAGKLMKVGAFGLGSKEAPLITDFTQDLSAGDYTYLEASAVGAPSSQSYYGHARVLRGDDNRVVIVATRLTSGNIRQWIGYRGTATGSLLWQEIYHQGSILGTVAQGAGVPTGALIERGSNANGEYVRYADGTQICTSPVLTFAPQTASNGVYISDPQTWTYPASFSFVGSGGATCVNDSMAWATATSGSSASEIRVIRPASATSRQVRAFAVGRWF
jgi:hypothetical protein